MNQTGFRRTQGGAWIDSGYQLATRTQTTALPTTGTSDGTMIRVAANASTDWYFRYDATTSYWKFAGGSPMVSEIDALETASASYVNLATIGPSVNVPFVGDYLLAFGAEAFSGTANAAAWMSIDISAGASDTDGAVIQQPSTVTAVASISRVRTKTIAAPGTSIVCKYRASAGTGSFLNRYLNVLPIKVH